MGWQYEVARAMIKSGFPKGRCNPCLYYIKSNGFSTFLHVGDSATVGSRESVAWLKKVLDTTKRKGFFETYKIKQLI